MVGFNGKLDSEFGNFRPRLVKSKSNEIINKATPAATAMSGKEMSLKATTCWTLLKKDGSATVGVGVTTGVGLGMSTAAIVAGTGVGQTNGFEVEFGVAEGAGVAGLADGTTVGEAVGVGMTISSPFEPLAG